MPAIAPAQRQQANEWLRGIAGDQAQLRDDQWQAIDQLVNDHRRLLVVQATGWGKSAVYFIAAKLLKERGRGVTVVISPLLALMRNQVESAARAGIRAVTLNSSNMTDWDAITAEVTADEADLLLISPERLNNPDFRDTILPQLAEAAGMVVVDEAHCISDWGHDFRPDYRRIKDLLAELPTDTPVLATTATANDRVVDDVLSQLGQDTGLLRGGLDRPSLHLGVVRLTDTTTRAAWIAQHLNELEGSGIIYCLTVKGAEELAQALSAVGFDVAAYTGRTEAYEREELETKLINNEVKALVATSALGMGFDKPDLGFVIHLGAPSSPVSYYQQIGRAGRSTQRAEVLLLPGAEDRDIWKYFASASFPAKESVHALMSALGEKPMSTVKLEAVVDLSRSRIEQALKVLDMDGAVRRVKGGWISTGVPWHYDAQRYAALDAAHQAEQDAMLDYETTTDCRLTFLRRQLDNASVDATTRCGRCDNCTGRYWPTTIDNAVSNEVSRSLDAPGVIIPARKQWPSGSPLRGRITGVGERRALGRLNDITRGPALKAVLSDATWRPNPQDWRDDPLLTQIVEVLAAWEWEQRPVSVMALGSTDAATTALVEALARAIASLGRMDFAGVLPVAENAVPVTAHNSAYRVAALEHHYDQGGLHPPSGPVLLVTGLVDTGWSITVAAAQLSRSTGADVLPFAVALQR